MRKSIYDAINPPKKHQNPKFWILIIAILVLIIGSTFVYKTFFSKPNIEFETASVHIGDVSSSISASGSLSPTNEVEIGSVISGIVLEVLVEENDFVKAGQVLARINPESINQQIARFNAQLNSARANLKAAQQTLEDKKWNYEKLQQLYNATNGMSPSILELQNAKTAYTSAKSDVEIKKASILEIETSLHTSQIDLKNSQIISPIDGVVLTKSIEAGQSVAASFQAPVLFKVAESLEEMVLKANISEADIGKIRAGQNVIFSVDAYPNKQFKAFVQKVNFGAGDGSSNNSSSGDIVSYIARIEVDNKNLLLRPGMSATAEIIIEQANGVVLVPNAALFFDLEKALERLEKKGGKNPMGSMFAPPQRPRAGINAPSASKGSKEREIWILDSENKVQKVQVQAGISDGEFTQVSGLAQNARVIIGIKNKK